MRRLVSRLAVTVATASLLTLLAGTAGASASTSGYNDWSCQPTAAHPNPVVTLHGLGATYYEDTGNYIAPYLAEQGYCVYGLTYGATSVFGPFVGGVGDVTESAQQIAQFINQVLASTHASKVDIVGHSEGGFESLYVPKVTGDAGEIARVVALAAPAHGTTFGGLYSLAQDLGLNELSNAIESGAGCVACTQVVTEGSAVKRLDSGPIAQPGITYTAMTSTKDELVTPTSSAFVNEPGVTNEYIQQFCPNDPVGHIGEAYDSDVAELIRNALDPAHATPVTCSYGQPY